MFCVTEMDKKNQRPTVIKSTHEIKIVSSWSAVAKCDMGKKKKEEVEDKTKVRSNEHDESMANLNNLPPEIVNKILELVSTCDLFTCRLVNWQWNETCSKFLHYRPSTQLKFTFDTTYQRWYQDLLLPSSSSITSTLPRRKTLCQFTKCYKKSRFFPFARYKLHDLNNNKKPDLLNFLDSCAHLFTSLQINAEKLDKNGGAILREILLEKSPNLQELIIKLDMRGRYFTREPWTLFPKTANNNIILPKLKILHLDQYYYCDQTERCVIDILESAINLERIEFSGGRETDTDFLQFMRSHGKIHLVKNIKVDFECLLNERELGLVKNLYKFPEQILPVEKLQLVTQSLENSVNPKANIVDWDSTGSFINKFVHKMKNTDGSGSLKEVEMNPLGHVPHLNWSVFNSVEKLKVCTAESQFPIFPLDSPALKIFPMLTQLELIHNVNDPFVFRSIDSIPVFPTVQILKLWAYKATPHLIKEMIIMCPNIRSLTLDDVDNFSLMGRAIWKYMKNITSLTIKLKADAKNFFPMVDSTFTGYSPEVCRNVMRKMTNSGAVSFDIGNIDRRNESILDLKHLMNLTIQLYISDIVYEKRRAFVEENRLEFKMVTDLSYHLAFNLMPNLQVQMINSCFDIYP